MNKHNYALKLLCSAMLILVASAAWADGNPDWPVRNTPRASKQQPRTPRMRAASADGTPIEFVGNVIYSGDDLDIGIYGFDTNSSSLNPVKVDDETYGNKGAIFVEGKYFCVGEFDLGIQTDTYATLFDTRTWSIIKQIESPSKSLYSYCMAQDPTTKIIYGFFRNEANDGWELGTIDIDQMVRTSTIAPMTGDKMVSISFSSTGQLYGIGFEEGTLYKIDKSTGETTVVGETEISQMYLTSGEIDPRTDKYYFAAQSFFDRALYEIDLSTGEAVEIMEEIPGEPQIMALHIVAPAAEQNAPAQVTDVILDFAAPSLSGQVSFTAPTATFDGTAASGALTYAIKANGTTLATGNTEYGKRETVSVTVPHPGNNLFQIIVANEHGQSPAAEVEKWIGQDTPAAPAQVNVARANGINTVQWSAVTEWLHGGEINGTVSYTVTRYPDNEVVANGITDLKIDDVCNFEEMTPVYYGVTAAADGSASAETISNAVVVGSIEPPFAETFETAESFLAFCVIDGDKDGNTWIWDANEKAASSTSNRKKNANDWLFTPPLRLKANYSYDVAFTIASENPFDPATMEVMLGTATSASAMDTQLLAPTELATMENQTFTGEISVETDGLYYIGFHSVSKPQMSAAMLYDIAVSKGVNLNAPAMVSINTTPNASGAPSVEIEVTVPKTAVDGTPIANVDKVVCKMDGAIIDERTNLNAGASFTINASADTAGYYIFSFAAYNASGEGEVLNASIYLGVNIPASPENVTVREEGNSGMVTVTWDKVTMDIDGYSIVPAFVTYTILCGEDIVAENITANTFEHQAVAANKQAFVKYSVMACTSAGCNDQGGESSYLFVGAPYTLPFVESFKNGVPAHYFLTIGMGQWQTTASEGYPTPDGCIVYVPQFIGSTSTLISGKISLVGAQTPKLSFATLNAPANTDALQVSVMDTETGETSTIGEITLDQSDNWLVSEYDMSAFANKNIMLNFKITTNQTGTYSMLDEIMLTDSSASKAVISVDSNLSISIDGNLVTATSDFEIQIVNLQGAVIAQGDRWLAATLANGAYIVKSQNTALKVFVK